MSEKELQQQIKKIREFTKQTISSKEKAQAFLKSTGIYTSSGHLSKIYK